MEDLKKLEAKIKESNSYLDEWSGLQPSDKEMGVVQFVLDKGVKTTAIGTIYGLDFEIEDDEYRIKVFFDYYNRRLKIVDYEAQNYTAMLQRLAYLAEVNSFDKIFVKSRKSDFQNFLCHGYLMEGVLKYYFKGEDAYILSRFTSADRLTSANLMKESELIENLIFQNAKGSLRPLDSNIEIVVAKEKNIAELVAIYRTVFDTYPSPLTNPDYIKATMRRNVSYRLARCEGIAIAAASLDIDWKHSNAEMTDCATSPSAQGKGLMQHLLLSLEDELREKKIKTAYTLARAMSSSMNRVFYKLDYEYCGRLINNCDIFGSFEDLNIWAKSLNTENNEVESKSS